MSIGQNTPAGRELLDIVERVEKVREEKKSLSELESAIMADAKARGFDTKTIRKAVKRRSMAPHDRQEEDALLDLYEHTLGGATESPLHRFVGQISRDTASREAVLDVLGQLVPNSGSITIDHGGRPVRLARDSGGNLSVEELDPGSPDLDMPAPPSAERPARHQKPVPDVDGDGAEKLGAQAYAANKAITSNPFPYADDRRPRFDKGWREASGSDGMGPR